MGYQLSRPPEMGGGFFSCINSLHPAGRQYVHVVCQVPAAASTFRGMLPPCLGGGPLALRRRWPSCLASELAMFDSNVCLRCSVFRRQPTWLHYRFLARSQQRVADERPRREVLHVQK